MSVRLSVSRDSAPLATGSSVSSSAENLDREFFLQKEKERVRFSIDTVPSGEQNNSYPYRYCLF